MNSKSPSSSSSSSHKWKYDVFLSFRGEDTRKNFTDHIYTTLKQKGIFTFRDDEELEKGKPIKPELLEAIEESQYAIVILSKNYASSTWCLDELVKIMDCKDKIGLIVYPIFYDVDPSEVRKQIGTYGRAFDIHEKENIYKVHMWRDALTKVANLFGFSLHDRYWMHDLLQIMGQDIARRGYPQEPGKWSRLWLCKDIHKALVKNTEMEAIQGLVVVKYEEKMKYWNLETFSKMPNLKLLIIHTFDLLHGPINLPNGLRYLDWSRYPVKSLPSNFQSNELVKLSMCHSKIEQLWKGLKHFEKLKFIKLNNSSKLIATPNLNGVPNLEKLVAKDCINLREVHPSVGVHKRLILLNLQGCKNLSRLLKKFEMESLKTLILSGCSKIKRIPEFFENMEQLSILYLDGTAITQLPSTVKHLTNLASLNLRDCKFLVYLPSICNCKLLKDISVSGCSKLHNPKNLWNNNSLEVLDASKITIRELPSLPGLRSLMSLNLSDCNIVTIPINFGYLPSLQFLNLSGNNFDCLPKSIIQLSRLYHFTLRNYTRLRSLPQLPSGSFIVFAEGCTSLETLSNLSNLPKFRLSNCFKLADNQGWTEMFFSMLSRYAQGIKDDFHLGYRPLATLNIVIPGSEIPRWFSHQSAGVKLPLFSSAIN